MHWGSGVKHSIPVHLYSHVADGRSVFGAYGWENNILRTLAFVFKIQFPFLSMGFNFSIFLQAIEKKRNGQIGQFWGFGSDSRRIARPGVR